MLEVIVFKFYNQIVFVLHNVPAVYDVLSARIEKRAAFFGAYKKCDGGLAWDRSVA
jgi:hypothetical protein